MADAESAAVQAEGEQKVLKQDDCQDSNTTSTEGKPEIKYPSGVILFAIVLGLMLSMFLVALDMVSREAPAQPTVDPDRHPPSLAAP